MLTLTRQRSLLTEGAQPNTIGLALFDSPVGQLTWIGEPYVLCTSIKLLFSRGAEVLNRFL